MRSFWGRAAAILAGASLVLVGQIPAVGSETASTTTVGATTTSETSGAPLRARTKGKVAPSAVAVDKKGTTYVGFGSGDAIARFKVSGTKLAAWKIPGSGPVSGLAVDSRQRVWVLRDDVVAVLGRGGGTVKTVERPSPDTCARNAKASALKYGGLTVLGSRVFLAGRCTARIDVLRAASGAHVATVRLPARARGLAVSPRVKKVKPRLFVALPDKGTIQVFSLSNLGKRRAVKVLRIGKPGKGGRPAPSGIAVDSEGHLAVTDARNQAVYLYNTVRSWNRYRVLGHPARARSSAGALARPTSLAQYAGAKGGFARNLFIGEVGNKRVQRWDSGGGYTYWVRTLTLPTVRSGGNGNGTDPDGTDPDGTDEEGTDEEETAPSITRPTIQVGADRLTCVPGPRPEGSSAYTFRWLRDGTVIGGEVSSVHLLVAADEQSELACRVTTTNSAGSATATSAAVFVGTPSAPVSTSAPTISGTAKVGRTLLCSTGTWSGAPAPRYAYVWTRDGVSVGNDPTYDVVAADVGEPLACTVIASNSAGSASATSDPVVPTA
ncbi:MAG: hypothetical protein CMH83_18445 [Nocardioides sp.]|nr:hypothetical protein [Nocardioides sp.]